ncbi:MAG: hypothetical protein GTO62_10840 [Planctomycetales bacterium]|nr:hypothetical protein [Planctomycetales bacterium]
MKIGTPELLKFKRLQKRLELPTYAVVGLLELLWLIAQRNARDGDIGRFTNEEIAAGLDWPGDPDQLINHLVECGWLDADPDARLVIHDWADHRPNWLTAAITRKRGSNGNGHPDPTATLFDK